MIKKYTVDDILPVLDGVKGTNGNYTAKCPAHDDNNNSFSVGSDSTGAAVCNCFAGCSQAEIWTALYEKLGRPETERPEPVKKSYQKPVVSYYYKNEQGETIDVKNRFEPGFNGAAKSFTWSIKAKNRRETLPPYHLQAILDNEQVFMVEGEKDADTLERLGFAATSTKDGVTSETAHYFTGKKIIIIEDNDAPGRKYARKVADIVRPVAASVKLVNLAAFFPALPVKGDITDYVEMNGTISDVINYAETVPEYMTDVNMAEDNEHPHAAIYEKIEHYSINKKGILIYTNGDTVTPLCYGSIIITDEITRNDGAGSEIYFRVEGITQSGHKLPSVTIPATDFDTLNWIRKAWGSQIVVMPTNSAKQKLSAGIVLTGQYGSRKTVYTHTGYITENKRPVDYISASGSLLNAGYLSEIESNLSRYQLAGVSTSETEKAEAIKASLQLLTAHAPGVVYPLFAFVYLAPLMPIVTETIGETGFCLYLQGKTQSGKSTLAALAASHFGRFTSMTPPVSFASTANYINELAFILKDCILWVDDFHPQGTRKEENKQNQIFQTIARAAGDSSSRGRLTSSARLQTAHPPRCLFLVTGEDMPQIGQSGSARVFTLEVKETRNDIKALRENARNGTLSRAMSDYISFIISNYETLKTDVLRCYDDIQNVVVNEYGENRLSNQTALLLLSVSLFVSYAESSGALSHEDATTIYKKAEKYINDNAREKQRQLTNEDPCKMYVNALRELISSGRRYVLDLNNDTEYEYNSLSLGADNKCIGWKDSRGYYLDGNASYTAVCEYYEKEHAFFNIYRLTLQKRLCDEGYTMPDSTKNPTINKRIGGRNVRVLRFSRALLDEAGDASGGDVT